MKISTPGPTALRISSTMCSASTSSSRWIRRGIPRQVAMSAQKRVELQRGVAIGDGPGGGAGELLGRRAAREPSIAVQLESIVEFAAEQLIDRQAKRLALNIPQRDVDTAHQRRHKAERAQRVEVRVQLVPDVLDARRILAHQQRPQPARRRGHERALRPARHLAQAANPSVRLDMQEHPRVARARQMASRNAGDLHVGTPASIATALDIGILGRL